MRRLWIAVALSLVGAHPAHAQVSLPKIFADHMVLQRNQPIGIYGWAAPGEQVNVTLDSRVRSRYRRPRSAAGRSRLRRMRQAVRSS